MNNLLKLFLKFYIESFKNKKIKNVFNINIKTSLILLN